MILDNDVTFAASDQQQQHIPRVSVRHKEALVKPYPDLQTARQKFNTDVALYYREHYPSIASSRSADHTYPDNIGHRNGPGRFRCHDGKHTSGDGKVLSMACTLCHPMPQRGPRACHQAGFVPRKECKDCHEK